MILNNFIFTEIQIPGTTESWEILKQGSTKPIGYVSLRNGVFRVYSTGTSDPVLTENTGHSYVNFFDDDASLARYLKLATQVLS